MKNVILSAILLTVLTLTSCVKGYQHEKVVTNNSRETIQVISGCCDQGETYTIAPGETETVFACVYQQVNRPEVEDLSWNVTLIQEGVKYDLNNPDLWTPQGNERLLKFAFSVND